MNRFKRLLGLEDTRSLEERTRPDGPLNVRLPKEVIDRDGNIGWEIGKTVTVNGVAKGPSGRTPGAYAVAKGKSGDPTRYILPGEGELGSVFFKNYREGILMGIGEDTVLVQWPEGLYHMRKEDVRNPRQPSMRVHPAKKAGVVVLAVDVLAEKGLQESHARKEGSSVVVYSQAHSSGGGGLRDHLSGEGSVLIYAARGRRTAASIVDLKGLDHYLADRVATAVLMQLNRGGWTYDDHATIAENLMLSDLLRSARLDDYPQARGVLRKQKADDLFRDVWLRWSPGYDHRGTFDARNKVISIQMGTILKEVMRKARINREVPSKEDIAAEFYRTIAHELRHAADWAYQEAAAPGNWLPRNLSTIRPDMLFEAQRDLPELRLKKGDDTMVEKYDRDAGVVDLIIPGGDVLEVPAAALITLMETKALTKRRTPSRTRHDQEADDAAYINTPTELLSWAGTAADKVWDLIGPQWRSLSGKDLWGWAQNLDRRDFLSKIDEAGRNDFMTRMVKALEQHESRTTGVVVRAAGPSTFGAIAVGALFLAPALVKQEVLRKQDAQSAVTNAGVTYGLRPEQPVVEVSGPRIAQRETSDLDELEVPQPVFEEGTPWNLRDEGAYLVDALTGKRYKKDRKTPPPLPDAPDLSSEEARDAWEEKLLPLFPEQDQEAWRATKKRYQSEDGDYTGQLPADLYKPVRTIPEPPKRTVGEKGADIKIGHDGGLKNIVNVLKAATPEEVSYWKDWYHYAREDVKALADRYDVPESVVAGIVAVLSPNVKWETNVHAAEQVLRGQGQKVIEYRRKLSEEAADNYAAKVFPDLYVEKETLGTFAYLSNIQKAQRILDAWNEHGVFDGRQGDAFQLEWQNPPPDKRRAPTETRGGDEVIYASPDQARRILWDHAKRGYVIYTTKSSPKGGRTWAKADPVDIEDGLPEGGRALIEPPISGPKVTAFYESIHDPERAQHKVVLDGHAQNIWYGVPQALNEMEVSTPPEELQQRMLRDYEKAAAMSEKLTGTKLTPQQVQAITWSVWRAAIEGTERVKRNTKKPKKKGAEDSVVVGQQRNDEVSVVVPAKHAGSHKPVQAFQERDRLLWVGMRNGRVNDGARAARIVDQVRDDLLVNSAGNHEASIVVLAKRSQASVVVSSDRVARPVQQDRLSLQRRGYQRFIGSMNGHAIRIAGDPLVQHGSFPAGRRQRRATVWKVAVDGQPVGEAHTFREARAMAEQACMAPRTASVVVRASLVDRETKTGDNNSHGTRSQKPAALQGQSHRGGGGASLSMLAARASGVHNQEHTHRVPSINEGRDWWLAGDPVRGRRARFRRVADKRLRGLRPEVMEAALTAAGFSWRRNRGDHRYYTNESGRITQIDWGKSPVRPGDVRAILEQTGLSESDLLVLLGMESGPSTVPEALHDSILTLTGEEFIEAPVAGYVLVDFAGGDVARATPNGIELTDAFFDLDTEGRQRALDRAQNRTASVVVRADVATARQPSPVMESVVVVLPIPPEIASQFPYKEQDTSPPHVTLAYVESVSVMRLQELEQLVASTMQHIDPIKVELTPGVAYFQNHKDQQIAHKSMESDTLEEAHNAVVAALRSGGFQVKTYDSGFKPHATLAYLDAPDYNGPVPEGSWVADHVEIWGEFPDAAMSVNQNVFVQNPEAA